LRSSHGDKLVFWSLLKPDDPSHPTQRLDACTAQLGPK
jgi:hypothetical protein